MSRHGNVLLIILLVVMVTTAIVGYWYWRSTSNAQKEVSSGQEKIDSQTPTARFLTKTGRLELFFESPNYPARKSNEAAYGGERFSGQRYVLGGGPIRNFYIDYYSSAEDLKQRTEFYRDGDGDNAGVGCFLTNEVVEVGKIKMQKTSCYYNPIGVTASGKYQEGVSTLTGNECIYWIDGSKTEALYFWAVAEEGHDTCSYLRRELKGLASKFIEGGKQIVGVIRQSGLAEDEKQRLGLPLAKYQVTDLENSSTVQGYFLKGDDRKSALMEGKCVVAVGEVDTGWEKTHNLGDSYQRSVLTVNEVEPISQGSCQPYPKIIEAERFRDMEKLKFQGKVRRERRPAPDINYDYSLELSKPYLDKTSSSGLPQEVKILVLTPVTNMVWREIEERLGKQVEVEGYLVWGYAESKHLEVINLK